MYKSYLNVYHTSWIDIGALYVQYIYLRHFNTSLDIASNIDLITHLIFLVEIIKFVL